jgi:hypothetical protein
MQKTEYLARSEKPKCMKELHGENTRLIKRKTQRNAPCPCGATKKTIEGDTKPVKFKHCCLVTHNKKVA